MVKIESTGANITYLTDSSLDKAIVVEGQAFVIIKNGVLCVDNPNIQAGSDVNISNVFSGNVAGRNIVINAPNAVFGSGNGGTVNFMNFAGRTVNVAGNVFAGNIVGGNANKVFVTLKGPVNNLELDLSATDFTVDDVDNLTVSAGASSNVQIGDVKTADVDVSSSATFKMGNYRELKASVSSSGTLEAGEGNIADIKASSSGTAKIKKTGKLNVSASSSATVKAEYVGVLNASASSSATVKVSEVGTVISNKSSSSGTVKIGAIVKNETTHINIV